MLLEIIEILRGIGMGMKIPKEGMAKVLMVRAILRDVTIARGVTRIMVRTKN